MPHPDFVALTPRRAIVGAEDDSWSVVEPLLIVSLDDSTKQVWFVCHGYSQLAEDFIRYVSILDDGSRFIVAPEALSRFYVKPATGKIGASWMTKEDRENEIQDYVRYLDALHDHVFRETDPSSVSLHVLGFSQGVATAARWAALGKGAPDQLVLWAEFLPPEFDTPQTARALRDLHITAVYGDSDEYITAEAIDRHTDQLQGLGLEFDVVVFEGGHRMDKKTLLRIAQGRSRAQ